MSLRRLVASFGFLAVAIVGVGCNGQVPDSSLATITPTCRVVNDLAEPLTAMMAAAQKDGVALQPETSSFLPPGEPLPPVIESCYRSLDGQVWWRDYYCSKGKCGNAAVPGSSRHGWGRAVDFQDQNGEMTFSSPGYAWLKMHAAEYGFSHPAWAEPGQPSAEAWHWEG